MLQIKVYNPERMVALAILCAFSTSGVFDALTYLAPDKQVKPCIHFAYMFERISILYVSNRTLSINRYTSAMIYSFSAQAGIPAYLEIADQICRTEEAYLC